MNLLQRLKEPSSQAGLALLVGTAAQAASTGGIPQDKVQAVVMLLQSIFGALAVLVPERK